MTKHILKSLSLLILAINVQAQYIGIGTDFPARSLEVKGTEDQFLRVRSLDNVGNEAGLDFFRNGIESLRQWRLTNQNGYLRLLASEDYFASQQEVMRINPAGFIGLGTSSPQAQLHIATGENASNSTDGYLLIGDKSGQNLVLDPNELIARSNGSAASLTFQAHGGNTWLQDNGGTAYLAAQGRVRIGGASSNGRLSIRRDNTFQMFLMNEEDNGNKWYIGASNGSWVAGDDQLLFSPIASSSAANFRLSSTTDNNGVTAPVVIHSGASDKLMIDGNEIDSDASLYINHNSNFNTNINAMSGQVGIGTNSAEATLHIKATTGNHNLYLRDGGHSWQLTPYEVSENLGFHYNGTLVAQIDEISGAWLAVSDRRRKSNIQPIESVLEKLNSIELKTYRFTYNDAPDRHAGVLAQQLLTLFPELVNTSGKNYTVAYSKLSVIAIRALQEQVAQIEALEEELESLLALAKSKTN